MELSRHISGAVDRVTLQYASFTYKIPFVIMGFLFESVTVFLAYNSIDAEAQLYLKAHKKYTW